MVKYRKNGTVVYTSTATPTYPLLVDTALFTASCTINNVVLSGNLGSSPPTVDFKRRNNIGYSEGLMNSISNRWEQARRGEIGCRIQIEDLVVLD